jgi:diadenosine tetraphosphate (Ap4A) HIT family hydrolase
MTKTIDCAICDQIKGRKEGDLLAQILGGDLPYQRYVIYEDAEFVVFPSIGPLTPGHIIVCSKVHYPSFASLPTEYIQHYPQVKFHLIGLLESKFHAPVHIFEHGSDALCKRIICTVGHAHLHFVPTEVDIENLLDKSISWIQTNADLSDLHTLTEGKEYLYYEAPNKNPLVAKARESGFESQLLRKVFAKALNNPTKWNWRKFPLPTEVWLTYQKLIEPIPFGN